MVNFISQFFCKKRKIRRFQREFTSLEQLASASLPRFTLAWDDRYPCLDDRTGSTLFDPHYIYHTSWAARKVCQTLPTFHVDISSSLYFCSLVSAFVPVRFYDYRPAQLKLSDLACERADLTRLPFPDSSVASPSCMHVVEHIGLGRYGDPLDYDGDLKAMAELSRVLAPGGSLLFVVPVGRPVIRFNAHRIYAYSQIREAFPDLALKEFTLIPDSAGETGLMIDCDPAVVEAQNYACGCFLFKRESTGAAL